MIETAEVFATILGDRLALMPGFSELIAALETAKIPKAIATSSNVDFVRDVLGRFELIPRFEFILTGEDVTHGKPHPEIYQRAARRFSLSPSEMMVLEDSRHGCAAAVAAGAFAVAVPAGRSHTHGFEAQRWSPTRCGIPAFTRHWDCRRRKGEKITRR